MLPISELHVVACGIATFAATVGYQYARRQSARRASMSSVEGKRHFHDSCSCRSSIESTDTCTRSDDERHDGSSPSSSTSNTSTLVDMPNNIATAENVIHSLKRKLTEDDTLDDPTPKRRCTPPLDEALPQIVTSQISCITPTQDSGTIVEGRKFQEDEDYIIVISPKQDLEEVVKVPNAHTGLASVPADVPLSVDEPQPDAALSAVKIELVSPLNATTVKTEKLASSPVPSPVLPGPTIEPEAALHTPVTANHPSASVECGPSIEPPLALPSSSVTIPDRPFTPIHNGFGTFALTVSPFGMNATPNGPLPPQNVWRPAGQTDSAHPFDKAFDSSDNLNGIESSAPKRGNLSVHPQLTGEEDEDVVTQLKGCKLFVKRGSKDFTDGMIGNLKLLSHKTWGDERILFRRDPLWQVTMNVRLRPSIRCSYDVHNLALRLVTKELKGGKDASEEVVIYALKRGRVPKDEFKSFAEGLVQNVHLSA